MADQAAGRVTLFLFLGGATLVPVAYKSLTTPATEQVERVPERAVSRPAAPRQAPTLSEMVSNNAWDGVVRENEIPVLQWSYLSDFGTFCS